MQWLRGWVSADAVRVEFTRLQDHKIASNKCVSCAERPKPCQHIKTSTFGDQMKELKRGRVLKPFILIAALNFLMETSASMVCRSYVIQVIAAYGIPMDAYFMATVLSAINLSGNFCFLFSVKLFGKRPLYLISAGVTAFCCIALSRDMHFFFPNLTK